MEDLEAEANRIFQASLASGSHLAYQRGVNAFQQFRYTYGFPDIWPANDWQVVAFISSLSLGGRAPSTISSYVAGVAFLHKLNNWVDPTKSFVVKKLLEGCKRLRGQKDCRAPITLEVLQAINTSVRCGVLIQL